jgi:hypothetical protein
MRLVFLGMVILFLPGCVFSQMRAGVGMAFSNDFFQSVNQPENISENSVRNVLISPSFGPKVYLGYPNFSFSMQLNIGISPIAYDWKEYKGMGVIYAPVLAGFNYGGLSGFTGDKSSWGIALAYGYHFTLTDLYFRNSTFRGEESELFFPPFVQIAGGFGGKGAALYLYSRIGIQPSQGQIFSFGLTLEVNFLERRKWRN